VNTHRVNLYMCWEYMPYVLGTYMPLATAQWPISREQICSLRKRAAIWGSLCICDITL